MSKLLRAVKAGFYDTNERFAKITPVSCINANADVMEIPSTTGNTLLRKLEVKIQGHYTYSESKLKNQGSEYLRNMDEQIAQSIMRQIVGDITDELINVSYSFYEKGMDEEGKKIQELVQWIYSGEK